MSTLNKMKHWWLGLWRYPQYRAIDSSYDVYWGQRDVSAPLNSFQKIRADLILEYLDDDSVLDVGSGDGRILAYLKKKRPGIQVQGLDSSDEAIKVARSRGVEVAKADLRDPNGLDGVREVDWILLLEVIEHFPDSERILKWAHGHIRKGVIFSVPNTGFIMHRLRLLFGRFPLQWKAHPSEHARFWTVRDMRWWLRQLGYDYTLHMYEGLPILNRVWPALFAEGMIVVVNSGYVKTDKGNMNDD